ncbi:hypothetical protein ACHAWF_010362 [Thalassiosira exigua]
MASLPSSGAAFTHLLALLAGAAIGKSIDADELAAYRSSGDTFWTKLRRKMKGIVAGGVALGLIYKTGSWAARGLLGDGSGRRGGGGGGEPAERRAQ